MPVPEIAGFSCVRDEEEVNRRSTSFALTGTIDLAIQVYRAPPCQSSPQ
jgi:hypothetical protein